MFIACLHQQNLIGELHRCTILQTVIAAICVLQLERLFSLEGDALSVNAVIYPVSEGVLGCGSQQGTQAGAQLPVPSVPAWMSYAKAEALWEKCSCRLAELARKGVIQCTLVQVNWKMRGVEIDLKYMFLVSNL